MSTDAATQLGGTIATRGRAARAERAALSWSTARLLATVALITGSTGLVATVGADSRWLAALGGSIVARGSVPAGIPFASAGSGHWHNTLVLAELAFYALERGLGDRGLILAQLAAVALALSILARDALAAGGRSIAISSALLLAAVGSIPSLAVARVQLFSLVLFPVMVALLRSEARRPSQRIWLALPLLALWSNLHGAALSGLAILYAYLALSRLRVDWATTVAVAAGAALAMCCTPAGIGTVAYYHGLVTNLAAERGLGQWAPLGQSPLDWVLVAAAVPLALRTARGGPRPWEAVVMIGLGVLTIKAARDGVWLLFLMVGPASLHTRVKRDWNGLVPVAGVLAIGLLALALARAPHAGGASRSIVARAIALAHGGPILADPIPAEQVALAGGRIWAGNPIDAFSRRVQGSYLDWVDGAGEGTVALAQPRVRVALVSRGSAAQRLTARDPAYVRAGADATAVIYVERQAGA
jgi:hypothetical protein